MGTATASLEATFQHTYAWARHTESAHSRRPPALLLLCWEPTAGGACGGKHHLLAITPPQNMPYHTLNTLHYTCTQPRLLSASALVGARRWPAPAVEEVASPKRPDHPYCSTTVAALPTAAAAAGGLWRTAHTTSPTTYTLTGHHAPNSQPHPSRPCWCTGTQSTARSLCSVGL